MEEFIFERNPRAEHLQVLTDGKLDQSEYLYPSGLADSIAVGQLFENGGSLVLPTPTLTSPSSATWCLSWTRSWAAGCRATSTCRRRESRRSFPTTTPTTSSSPRPTARNNGFCSRDPIRRRRPGRSTGRSTPRGGTGQLHTRPGDLCYVPRGVMHARPRTGCHHVTIGVHWVRVSNLVLDIVQRAIEHQPELQRIVPHGWWREGEPSRRRRAGARRAAVPGRRGADRAGASAPA